MQKAYHLFIHNNVFDSNYAFRGGAINIYQQDMQYDSLPQIINNTFYNNYAEDVGGGIRISGVGEHEVVTFNNLFWLNEAGGLPASSSISNANDASIYNPYFIV